MNYGILVATAEDGSFQIIGAVDSRDEAVELANNYIAIGPDAGYLAPFEFQIHRRGDGGGYVNVEKVAA